MDLQKSITSVFYFFKYSLTENKRTEKHPWKKKLKSKKKNKKNPQQPSNVRWLSISEAIDALHGSWGVLLMTLENEIETNKIAEARGILKKLTTLNF